MTDTPTYRYRPVFAGKTADGERVVVYRTANDQLHIRRPDGELWALSPGSEVTLWQDPFDDSLHLGITSREWCGMAVGHRRDLIEEQSLK